LPIVAQRSEAFTDARSRQHADMGAADEAFPPDRLGGRANRNRESLAAGTRLDGFEILRIIGSGGFGTVYLANDRTLDRDVAIKEYLPAQIAFRARGMHVAVRSPELAAAYAGGLKSFINEARILARFSHPAVVEVHRFWEANGTAYMVMPYVRGPTLRELRRSMKAPPTEAWLRSVLDPLLDALAMLHAEGIYHRDIAPDNVLLPTLHEPVLLDFGAARRVIGDRSHSITAVLKPSFAPIEQYAEANALRQGPWDPARLDRATGRAAARHAAAFGGDGGRRLAGRGVRGRARGAARGAGRAAGRTLARSGATDHAEVRGRRGRPDRRSRTARRRHDGRPNGRAAAGAADGRGNEDGRRRRAPAADHATFDAGQTQQASQRGGGAETAVRSRARQADAAAGARSERGLRRSQLLRDRHLHQPPLRGAEVQESRAVRAAA
jgi:tRNA A-37 threonylcarbamoyl transferase component Bud32